MLSRVETRFAPAVVTVVREVDYSPALLLESSFDASITDSSEFRKACQWGFDAYFEFMYEWDSSGVELVFVPRFYPWGEVVELVVETALREDGAGYRTSRDWRAGFGLGWLSALALVNRQEAIMGLTMLTALIVVPAPERKLVA